MREVFENNTNTRMIITEDGIHFTEKGKSVIIPRDKITKPLKLTLGGLSISVDKKSYIYTTVEKGQKERLKAIFEVFNPLIGQPVDKELNEADFGIVEDIPDPNLVFDFKSSVGDGLKVYKDRVVISHTGVLNLMAMGIKGDKNIFYTDLTAVEFKKANWTSGRIQFSMLGGKESVGGAFAASADENTITFGSNDNEIAEKMVAYIQERIKEARQPKVITTSVSSADEVMKLKNLLDMGIITQEEFDAKKKQLLGL